MAFSPTTNRSIKRNVQRVEVNKFGAWTPEPDMLCESITRGIGTAGSSANFILPRQLWDQQYDRFTGAEVAVYASENGSSETNATPWFHGWIVTEPRAYGARKNTYSVTAVSVIRLLDKVPVGVDGWTFRDWNGTAITSRLKDTMCPRYPRLSAMRNGERRVLWHPRDVMLDLFRGLPSYWSQAVGLGSTDVLREQPYKTKGLVEWDFTAVSMLEAIETLVSSWGDVGFLERFSPGGSPRVELDFFRIADPSTGRKTISVPSCGSANQLGVKEIGGTTEVADRIDRVIFAGAPLRVMLTCWTGDENPLRRLRRAWVSKQLTITQTTFDEATNSPVSADVTKSVEEWVLDDPDYGRRGSDIFNADCEFVFRQYSLAPCLLSEGLSIDKDNAVRQLQNDPAEDNPKRLSQQVFKTRLTYSTRKTDFEIQANLAASGYLTSSYGYYCDGDYGYGYGYEAAGGFRLLNTSQVDLVGEIIPDAVDGNEEQFPLEMLDGATVGADGMLLLSEPAVNVIFKGYCGNKEQVIRAEADVAVTITVASEERLIMDTGQPPYQSGRLSLIGNDGTCLAQKKDDWEYAQITTLGNGPRLENGHVVQFAFTDPLTQTPVEFDWCVYQMIYDPDADSPEVAAQNDNEIKILRHVYEQEVIRNDYPIMRELGRRLLKLKSRPKRTYEVTFPICTQAYFPADMVNFQGVGDVVLDDYTVAQVDIKFQPTGTGFTTTLAVDNAKPEESIRLET